MAIDYDGRYKAFYLICDECGEPSMDTFDSFDAAKLGARILGWSLRRGAGGDWENVCADCGEQKSLSPEQGG